MYSLVVLLVLRLFPVKKWSAPRFGHGRRVGACAWSSTRPPQLPANLSHHPCCSSSASHYPQNLRTPEPQNKPQSCHGDTIPGYVRRLASTPNGITANSKQTTIFSPEGRLYQVEYALEAISHAGTALGILAQDGIVLAAERKVTSKLLEQDTSAEKLYILNECVTTL